MSRLAPFRAASPASVWRHVLRRMRRRDARLTLKYLAAEVPAGGRVLDLGCGRGHVGCLLEEEWGCRAVGCDVVPGNEVLGRFCLFDGRCLPFRSGAFDAVVLAFVLHHAADPITLLQEVARVSTGPLLVMEDTPGCYFDRVAGARHVRRFNRKLGLPWLGRVRTEAEWRRVFGGIGLRVLRAQRIPRFERCATPVGRTAFVLLPGHCSSPAR